MIFELSTGHEYSDIKRAHDYFVNDPDMFPKFKNAIYGIIKKKKAKELIDLEYNKFLGIQ